MGGEGKIGGASGGGGGGGGGGAGFRSRMEHFLYSGDKKHVAAGIAVISIIFGIPWVLMSRGSFFVSFTNFCICYSTFVSGYTWENENRTEVFKSSFLFSRELEK